MATVLAVDDDPQVLGLVRAVLELDGHRVVTATSGDEALLPLTRDRPDVVVLDVMMPGADGWQVLARLNDPELDAGAVPVIVLTALDGDEHRLRGGIEGALVHITKPFPPAQLSAEVARVLGGDPEPERRLRVQRSSLVELARLEKREAQARGDTSKMAFVASGVERLSEKQRSLLRVLAKSSSVTEAAESLGVSRSNVYASLRRISRALGTRSVAELLAMVRTGDLLRAAAR